MKYCKGGHENEIYTADIGTCKFCEGSTESGGIEICQSCSESRKICRFCGLNLKKKEVCNGHKNESFTCDVGCCSDCGGYTSSGSITLCDNCGNKKNICNICFKEKN
jgi:hypothetical protein